MRRRSLSLVLGAVCTLIASPSLAGSPPAARGVGTDYVDDQIIVTLVPGAAIDDVNATWGTTTLEAVPALNLYLLEALGVPDLPALAVQMETTDARVDAAEVNIIQDTPEGVRAMVLGAVGGTVSDFEDQALTARIGLDEAHVLSRGAGVLIAVLDTGVDVDHEVFRGRLSRMALDLVDGDTMPDETANGIDDDGDGLTDEGYGHGTMVAGIIALVAPEARILPLRVLDDEGRGDAWRVLAGIRYAEQVGADILNMSFGVPDKISPMRYVLRDMYDAGFVLIAGAGNENREDPIYFPGEVDEVFLVTALDSMDVKADFADYNEETLVSAPGTGVRSAYPDGEWALGSGCSFATPFVSGEAALILSQHPTDSPSQVRQRIRSAVDGIYQLPGNGPYAQDQQLGSGRVFLPDALDGTVTVGGVDPTVAPLRVAPNPTAGALRIDLAFGAGTAGHPVVVDIFDAAGRRVCSLDALSGTRVIWNGHATSGRDVPPGVYYLRVTQGSTEVGTASIRKLR